MAKTKSTRTRSQTFSPIPPARKIDLTRFKRDIPLEDYAEILQPVAARPIFLEPIETLSPTKTAGKGRTALTAIEPYLFRADSGNGPGAPHVSFDRRLSSHANPRIRIGFQASGYGITTPGTYIMTFAIWTSGSCTFNIGAGPVLQGSIAGTGSRTLSGGHLVSVVFRNQPATYVLSAYLEQTAGGTWSWVSTSVGHPPLVLGL